MKDETKKALINLGKSVLTAVIAFATTMVTIIFNGGL